MRATNEFLLKAHRFRHRATLRESTKTTIDRVIDSKMANFFLLSFAWKSRDKYNLESISISPLTRLGCVVSMNVYEYWFVSVSILYAVCAQRKEL